MSKGIRHRVFVRGTKLRWTRDDDHVRHVRVGRWCHVTQSRSLRTGRWTRPEVGWSTTSNVKYDRAKAMVRELEDAIMISALLWVLASGRSPRETVGARERGAPL